MQHAHLHLGDGRRRVNWRARRGDAPVTCEMEAPDGGREEGDRSVARAGTAGAHREDRPAERAEERAEEDGGVGVPSDADTQEGAAKDRCIGVGECASAFSALSGRRSNAAPSGNAARAVIELAEYGRSTYRAAAEACGGGRGDAAEQCGRRCLPSAGVADRLLGWAGVGASRAGVLG